MHQNANGGYLWGMGIMGDCCIFTLCFYVFSGCLQGICIAGKIRKITINAIKNEKKIK